MNYLRFETGIGQSVEDKGIVRALSQTPEPRCYEIRQSERSMVQLKLDSKLCNPGPGYAVSC